MKTALVKYGIEQSRKFLSGLLKKDAAARKRAKRLETLSLSEKGINNFISIAFMQDPGLSRDLRVGVSGLSSVLRTTLKLADESDPFRATMLSFNLVGTAFSLMNAFGKRGPTYNQIILKEIRALSGQLKKLGKDMHRRFDHIERILTALGEHLDDRFDEINKKLADIIVAIDNNQEKARILELIRDAAISHLLTNPFSINRDKCLSGISLVEMSSKEFGDCLADFKSYAVDVAKLDMISGYGLVPSDVDSKVILSLYLSVDGAKALGYLNHYYVVSSGDNSRDLIRTVNPSEWAKGVDAFITLVRNSKNIEKVSKKWTFARTVHEELAKLEAMETEGLRSKEAIAFHRKDGLANLSRVYRETAGLLGTRSSKLTLDRLIKKSLGITREVDGQSTAILLENNHSSRPYGEYTHTRSIELTEGPATRITVESGTFTGRVYTTDQRNDAGTRDGIRAYGSSRTYGDFPMRTIRDKKETRIELRTLYFDQLYSRQFSAGIRKHISQELESALEDPTVEQIISRLGLLTDLMLQSALLGRQPPLRAEVQDLVKAILALGLKVNNFAGEIVALDGNLPGDAKFSEALKRGVESIFTKQLVTLDSALSQVSEDDFSPYIEKYLRELQWMISEARR